MVQGSQLSNFKDRFRVEGSGLEVEGFGVGFWVHRAQEEGVSGLLRAVLGQALNPKP